MKKIFKPSIVLFSLIVFVLMFSNKQRASEIFPTFPNRDVPIESILKLTEECRSTTGNIASNVIGVGVIGPGRDGIASALKDLGIKWVRTDILWWATENSSGSYDWSWSDAYIESMQKNDIELALMLNHAPNWFNNWDDIHFHYNEFVRLAVERYKPGGILAKQMGWENYGVRYWEIFNEPNLAGEGWLSREDDPSLHIDEYALVLASANNVIREEDPGAVIIIGGFSPIGGLSSWSPAGRQFINYEKFIEELYMYNNMGSCYDIFAFHPYDREGKFNETITEIENVLSEAGDKGKPIWFNEHGTDKDSERGDLLENVFQEVGEPDGYFWFSLDDFSPREGKFGLLEFNMEPKDEYYLFKNYLEKVK